jgi:hypothetical protein
LEEIDEAFNWLVLILSILTAALMQYPQLYPFPFPHHLLHPEITMMRLLLLPLSILIIAWLSSLLTQRQNVKIVLKCFAWIFTLFILVMDVVLILAAIVGTHYISFFVVPGWLLAIAVYLGVILNRYRELFPDSRFLISMKIQVLFCIILFLIMELHIVIFLGPF